MAVSEMTRLRRLAESQGWEVKTAGDGAMFYPADKAHSPIKVSAHVSVNAPGRMFHNLEAQLKRAGLLLDPPKKATTPLEPDPVPIEPTPVPLQPRVAGATVKASGQPDVDKLVASLLTNFGNNIYALLTAYDKVGAGLLEEAMDLVSISEKKTEEYRLQAENANKAAAKAEAARKECTEQIKDLRKQLDFEIARADKAVGKLKSFRSLFSEED